MKENAPRKKSLMEWLIMSITSLISFACGTLLFFPFVNGWNNYYMFGVATVICAVGGPCFPKVGYEEGGERVTMACVY